MCHSEERSLRRGISRTMREIPRFARNDNSVFRGFAARQDSLLQRSCITSYNKIPAATAKFNELTLPIMGSFTV